MSEVTTEGPRHQQQVCEANERQSQHGVNDDKNKGDTPTFSIAVVDELHLLSRMLREKVRGDEAFLHWLINEITAYGILSSEKGSSVLSISGELEDSSLQMLSDIVDQYPSNELVHRDVLRTLGNSVCSLDVDSCVAIAMQGGIELVIRTMRKFSYNEQIQQYGCLALGGLAISHNVPAAMSERGAVDSVIHAMNKFPTNKRLQGNGCVALGNLALNDNVRVMVARQGGIERVIQAMTAFAGSRRVDLYGCFALAIFAVNDNEVCAAIALQGGIDLVAQTMGKFPDDEQIQQFGCLAFGNFTWNLGICPAVVRQGGIELVVRAMTKYTNNEQLQQYGCSALGNLSVDVHGDDRVGSIITESEGLELVISAMERFPSNESLQVHGCFTLGNLASMAVQSKATICLDLVVGAMRRFQSSDKLLRLGCYALESWASESASVECRSHLVETLDGVNLARHVWNVLLSQEAKDVLHSHILTIRNRLIFDDEFLSKSKVSV